MQFLWYIIGIFCASVSALLPLNIDTSDDDPLVVSCMGKMYDQTQNCGEQAIKDWNITEKTDPKSKNACCSAWEEGDCLVIAAKAKCSADEVTHFQTYIKTLFADEEKENCQKYPYQSKECKLTRN